MLNAASDMLPEAAVLVLLTFPYLVDVFLPISFRQLA